MKIEEVLEKVEEFAQNVSMFNDCELNRVAGFMEGFLARKELDEEERKEPA